MSRRRIFWSGPAHTGSPTFPEPPPTGAGRCMSPSALRIAPQYIRLSGEIVDQAILNRLRSFYPQARIAHAFASTEAGVAFDVNDGLAGFPASFIGSVAATWR